MSDETTQQPETRTARKRRTKAAELESAPVKAVEAPDYSQTFLARIGVPICLNCGTKRRLDADGTIVECCDHPRFE